MKLTTKQLNILNHAVVDGQAWADHATEEHMLVKVEKYRQSYLDAQGSSYKTRKEVDDAQAQAEQDEYDNAPWNLKREREYPTLKELTIALYDTDDRAAIDKRRSDVKKKFPKPA